MKEAGRRTEGRKAPPCVFKTLKDIDPATAELMSLLKATMV